MKYDMDAVDTLEMRYGGRGYALNAIWMLRLRWGCDVEAVDIRMEFDMDAVDSHGMLHGGRGCVGDAIWRPWIGMGCDMEAVDTPGTL